MGIKSIYEGVSRWFLLDFVGKVKWKLKRGLTDQDREQLHKLLEEDYYIILTRRRNHLSTYLTSLGNLLLTGRWGFWSHALMNLEDEVKSKDDFRLIEAVSRGVSYSPFNEVFDVDAVVLLKPKRLAIGEWTAILDSSKEYLGRKYDTLFDLAHDNKLSCVELVHNVIKRVPGYKVIFADFESAIERRKNLTPQMYYDSADFEVVFELRR